MTTETMHDPAFSTVFLPPPVDIVAQYPHLPLILAIALAVVGVVAGAIYTWMTKSPLFIATAVAGLTLYPFLVEPTGDHFVAVWYPDNFDIAATVFDRPIPWFVVLFYGAGIPLASVAAYEVAKRGLPARYLLAFVAAVTVLEVPIEMIASHLHWMNYYGNHATILGEPIYCLP